MYRSAKIAAIGLCALALAGCISSSPEVMVDTDAKTKQASPGELQNVVPADNQ
jgi:outer membrane lipoprotein SlyB